MPLLSSTGSSAFIKAGPSAPAGFVFNKTISSNTQYYNLRADAIANGWDGTTLITATITVNSGVYVWSDDVTRSAFDTGSPFPSGSTLTLINNGFIIGKGGKGGGQLVYNSTSRETAQAGGPALNMQFNLRINNGSYIAGGGGGGGWVANTSTATASVGGGGGAGGGTGGTGGVSGGALSPGDPGGQPGGAGSPLTGAVGSTRGASGGRVLPGIAVARKSVGTQAAALISGECGTTAGGGGGISLAGQPATSKTIQAAVGGYAGNNGDSPINYSVAQAGFAMGGGGGGGWGAVGGNGAGVVNSATNTSNGTGGIGGKAINLNGNVITWLNMGTVWGGIN